MILSTLVPCKTVSMNIENPNENGTRYKLSAARRGFANRVYIALKPKNAAMRPKREGILLRNPRY